MAEYTGEVVPFDAPVNPATGKPTGAVVNAASTKNQESYEKFSNDLDSWQSWLNNPATFVAAGGAATEAARRIYPFLKDKLKGPEVPDVSGRIEPTMTPAPAPEQTVTPEPGQPTVKKLADLEAMVNASKTPQAPVQALVQQPNAPIAPPELAGPPQQQFPPRPMAPPPLEGPPQQQFPPAPPATPVETVEKLIEGQPLAIAQKKGLQPMPKDLMFNGEPVTPGGRQVLTAFGYSQNPELAMQRYQGLVEALGKQPTAGPKGGAIVEAPQYEAFLDKQVGASRYPLSKDFYAAKKGATAGTMKEFTGPVAPKQAGGISPAMALNLAGNALGAVNIGKQLKQGDYSGAGVDAFIQLLSNLAPRLGLGAALMSPGNVSSGTLNSPEAQELMKRVKKPY